MDLRVSSCVITHKNTLEDIHKNCQSIAFEYHDQQTRKFQTYFSPKVYHKLNSTNKESLTEDIRSKQQKYESNIILNKEQTSQYIAIYYGYKSLIAGYYSDHKITLIKDNTGNCVRDNSIALCNGRVYYGYESDIEYRNDYTPKNFPNNFNMIRELLNANIKTFSACELNQYCIKLKNDNRFTGDTYNSLCLETLIALQLLKTKIDAEDQIQQCVANMVFTVPQYLSFREINLLRNSAKLAGFESQNYFLSEINALAMNYIFGEKHVSPNETKNVFIIALNQTIYDAAICLVNRSIIKHVSHSRGKLSNTTQVLQAFQSLFRVFSGGQETTSNFNEALNITENYGKEINHVLIVGHSFYKESVIKMLSEKRFSYHQILLCNDQDLINGAVIYSDILSNYKKFNIYELAKHSIAIKFAYKVSEPEKYDLVIFGQPIENISKSFQVPNYEFPIDVYILQQDVCVEHYYVPAVQRKQTCLHMFDCHVRSNDRIEINYSIDNIYRKAMTDYKQAIGNREEMLAIEKQKFESFEKSMRKEKEDYKQSLTIRGMKKELWQLFETLTREIENSTDISRLKKKSCIDTMDSALKTINSDRSKPSDFEKQITTLNELLHSILK